MKQYVNLIDKVMKFGTDYEDRTGVGRRSIYGETMKFDLNNGFPLVTVKKTFLRGIIHELLWFLRGETNIKPLVDNKVHIWDAWADEDGELGPVYGAMWRNWPGDIDQLAELVANLKKNPQSSRHIVSGWNPALLPDPTIDPKENVKYGKQALPPCHTLWQVFVDGNDKVHMTLYQRSADMFLGVPFNIASYSLLLKMIAYHLNLKEGVFTWMGGDCHLYSNHLLGASVIVEREPKPLPEIKLNYPRETPLWEVKPEDIELIGYDHHPAYKAEVAV